MVRAGICTPVIDVMDVEIEKLPEAKRPRTGTVIALLSIAAATFSYLGAYAVTGALAQANVIRPLSRNPDPRPIWALASFCTMMLGSLLMALMMRYLSYRQNRRIDQIGEEEPI